MISEARRARKRETNLAWRKANVDRRRAYAKAYYEANAEAEASRRRRFREVNPEYQRDWRAANPGRYAEADCVRSAAWKRANPATVAAQGATRRARKLGAFGTATVAEIAARWTYFGDKCWVCGGIATATDHVKPLAKGGSNWPANLRPVCGSCNSSKGAIWPLTVAA